MDRSEVARLVAEALGVAEDQGNAWYETSKPGLLYKDGFNIGSNYWRCRCEEWLLERGLTLRLSPTGEQSCYEDFGFWLEILGIHSPLAEAPARLVAEVWCRQQQQHQQGAA